MFHIRCFVRIYFCRYVCNCNLTKFIQGIGLLYSKTSKNYLFELFSGGMKLFFLILKKKIDSFQKVYEWLSN